LIRETSRSFRGVPSGFVGSATIVPVKPTTSANELRQLADGEVVAHADVDVVGLVVGVEQVQDGGGHVVDVEELAPGLSAPPEHHGLGAVDNGLVEAPDEGGQDTRGLAVEVRARTVRLLDMAEIHDTPYCRRCACTCRMPAILAIA
jgi:hypothetical protein